MRAIKIITKNKVLVYDNGNMLSYHKGKIYIENGSTKKYICDVPIFGIRKLLCRVRILERMLRLEPRVACNLGGGQYLLSCLGKVYCVDSNNDSIETELNLRSRMNNPLAFTRSIDRRGETESILFGEYFSNNDQEEVAIYERKDSTWSKIYSFAPGTIYHIHGIVQGNEKDSYYVLTGDSDQESGIWQTKDHFKTMKCIAGGSQQFRSCVAFPYQKGLLYATDTPREKNYLYYLHPQGDTWRAEKVYEMPGPCIYGTKRNKALIFATSVEADDTLPSWRYRFSRKLGAGVKDFYTHIICVKENGDIEELAKLKKDFLPMLVFQFGNCLFPDSVKDDPLVFTPISVYKYDGKTVLING